MVALMDAKVPVLIVSCRPENRKLLLKIFDGLPLNTYCASSLKQARETLELRRCALVFCEERLGDGSYEEFLAELREAKQSTRFVVMLCTGEWDEYLDALRAGADEVLRCPLEPTEVDLALIHAMRERSGSSAFARAESLEIRSMGTVA
jgi:DNA-binding NtrC family response regulator